MKLKRLSYSLAFGLVLAAGCGGTEEHVETPPTKPPPAPASAEPVAPPPTSATPAASAVPSAEPAAKKEEPPPAPQKTLKEKLVGVWVLDFSGDVKTAAEEAAKKKGGKDEKKVADLLKKAEEATAKNKVEDNGDTMSMWEAGKATSKSKFEVVKEDGGVITVKHVGKDEVTKKDAPTVEIAITFKDDNTIELKDPKEKDPKKAKTLVFKRSADAPTPAAAPPADKPGAAVKPGSAAAIKPADGAAPPAAKPGSAPSGKL